MTGQCQTRCQYMVLSGFYISKFDESFIKSYYEESDEEYFLDVDVQHPEKLRNLHNSLLFLPERMKIEKVEKLVANLHDKTEYVIHIKNFKASFKSWINSEKSSSSH